METTLNNTSIEEANIPTTDEQQEEAKTYTQDEVIKLLQSETDKRVTQALKKQQAKYEAKLSLSKLDDNERAKAEKDQEIAELKEQLAAFQIERNKSELKSVLGARGLSAEFADIIAINDDLEASQANIERLDRLFKAAVKAEVEKRLAGNAPKGNLGTNPTINKKELKNMSIAELREFKNNFPEEYARLYAN